MATYTPTSNLNTVRYTSATAITNGQVVVIGGKVFIASMGISAGASGLLYCAGNASFPKGTTATTIAVGDALYWSTADTVATNSTVGTTLIGQAWEAAGTAAGTIEARIIH